MEKFSSSILTLAKHIAHLIIKTGITNYSLFGRSLGALVGWKITLELKKTMTLCQEIYGFRQEEHITSIPLQLGKVF